MADDSNTITTTAVVLYDESRRLDIDVRTQVDKQRRLAWQRRAELVQSPKPLTKEGLALVDAIVHATGIPYHMIAMIPVGRGSAVKPYIYADGWFLKARTDPRGIASLTYPEVKLDYENGTVTVRCLLTLGSGQVFEGLVFKTINDERAKDSTGNWTKMVNKAITQARGKAAYEAVGGTFPGIAEEYQDIAEFNGKAATVDFTPKASIIPANAAQLLARANAELKIPAAKSLEILGAKTLADITDIGAAWDTLKAMVKE